MDNAENHATGNARSTNKNYIRLKPILKVAFHSFLWATGLALLFTLGWLAIIPETMDTYGFMPIMMMIFLVPACFVITFVLMLLIYTIKHFLANGLKS